MSGSGETPGSARRRVGLAIRLAREAKGWTQTHVAEEMEWSLSKVMRIESGEVTISPNDLRPLLTFLGVRDKATVDGLIASAKLSKQRRQWWDAPELKDGFTLACKQLVQVEPDAMAIRYYYPLLGPAHFQTPTYAAAILESFRPPMSYAVIDESVLLRQTGGKQALVEQRQELVRVSDNSRIRLWIIPLSYRRGRANDGLVRDRLPGEEGHERERLSLSREQSRQHPSARLAVGTTVEHDLLRIRLQRPAPTTNDEQSRHQLRPGDRAAGHTIYER